MIESTKKQAQFNRCHKKYFLYHDSDYARAQKYKRLQILILKKYIKK
jgi:hypothetical protein